jgi:hypothetical protein
MMKKRASAHKRIEYDEPPTARTLLYLSPTDKEKLKALALEARLSLSDYIREMIKAELRRAERGNKEAA